MLFESAMLEVPAESTGMKESLAHQILTSMMTSEDDWLAQSPVPSSSSQPAQQLEVDVLEGVLDTDERVPVFYSNGDLDLNQIPLELDLTELTAATYEVTPVIDAACASTSALDVDGSLDLDAAFSTETEGSIDVESCSSWDASDVFDRASRSSSLGGDVKEELKHRIRTKRMASGQGDITVEFSAPEPEILTEEEEKLRLERREKNRLAAQKCRNRKRERAEVLENDIAKLQTRRSELQDVVEKLKEEKEKLEQIINFHGSVCPKMRRVSKR